MINFECILCKNYWGVGKCEAYPDGIPAKIFEGELHHKTKRKGDNGIQFEPIKKPRKKSDE